MRNNFDWIQIGIIDPTWPTRCPDNIVLSSKRWFFGIASSLRSQQDYRTLPLVRCNISTP
jgi:hypothetical protein